MLVVAHVRSRSAEEPTLQSFLMYEDLCAAYMIQSFTGYTEI